jgi:hypothetical protein
MTRAIRIGIPAAAVAALALGLTLPTPHNLPSLALGSREVLWAERTLVFFYAFLLLLVPILKALGGELPIELSTRGARYAEASDTALEELKTRIDENEELLDDTIESLETIATRLQEEAELHSDT